MNLFSSPPDALQPGSVLRVLIADDERPARDAVRLALRGLRNVEIVGECADGETTVNAIRSLAPDLVLLDVQMPGMSGFDVVEAIGVERMPSVVFVTAFDDYTLDAFEVRAVDYLLKPFEDARVHEAVRRVMERHQRTSIDVMMHHVEGLVSRLASTESPQPITRFVIRDDERAIMVRAVDVEWIESSGNYVVLHTNSARHRLRATLKVLLPQLDATRFARVHRSAIVNLDRIREVQPWFGGDHLAIMHGGAKVRISRTFAGNVLKPLQ